MIFPITKRPDGRNPNAIFDQRLQDAAMGQSLNQVQGNRVSRTTRGSSMIPEEASSTSASSKAKRYRLKDVKDDYLICHTWDGTDEGTDPVYIAKEDFHRSSLASATLIGDAQTYTYADGPSETWAAGASGHYNKKRMVAAPGEDDIFEEQRISPPWRENEVITAISADTGVTTDEGDGAETVSLLIISRSGDWTSING